MRKFTLIEMLVVIAIIGILAGLLSGPVMNSRRQGLLAACTNNLHQCGTMINLYQTSWNSNYPLWLSESEYGGNKQIFLCPLDDSKGAEGSRPDWVSDTQYAETNDMPTSKLTATDSSQRGSYPEGSYEPQKGWDSKKQIEAFSYMYEFCGAPCSWLTNPSDYGLSGSFATWQQAKLVEAKRADMEVDKRGGGKEHRNVSPFVPVVRCYHHNENRGNRNLDDRDRILNYRVNGQISNSPPNFWWEVVN